MNTTRTRPIAAPAEESRSSVLADLIDQLTARAQGGEVLDAAALSAEFPDFADDLERLLPALGLLGNLSRSREPLGRMPDGAPRELGDYRIVREVGRGGMGVVYEAEQISLNRRVALKVLPIAAVMDPRQLQRFHNEAVAAAGLDHPHVVKVFSVGCERSVHFIAMQFIDGQTLADLIRERLDGPVEPRVGVHDETRSFTPDGTVDAQTATRSKKASSLPSDAAYARQVAMWGIQAAEALEHAHALGIVHRDVKPGNLLIDGHGELFVADFGLARLPADVGVTGTGDLLGTVRYMSPEQALAQHGLVDHRSDVYSLGATLYEMLALVPAVGGKEQVEVLRRIADENPVSLRKLDPRVPRDLETVVFKCLEKDPARRYQSAKNLADDLHRFLEYKPVRAKRNGRVATARRWCRRNPALTALACVILLATMGLSITAVLFWNEKQFAEGEKKKAEDEKQRAEDEKAHAEAAYREEVRHRARARQSVDTMYTDVAERLLSREPGMAGVRREFLLKALAFYEEEAAEQGNDPETRLRMAEANKRAGRIHWMNGDMAKAGPAYDRAVALAEEHLAGAPTDPHRRFVLAQFYFERSWVQDLKFDGERLNDRRRALAMFEQLAKEFPRDGLFRRSETHVSIRLGMLVPRPEAEAQYRRGMALAEQLAQDFPSETAFRLETAFACMDLGLFLMTVSLEHQGEAEELLTRSNAVWRAAAEATGDPENWYHVGLTLQSIGEIRARGKQPDTARDAFQQALIVHSRLAANDTEMIGYEREAARATKSLGHIFTRGRGVYGTEIDEFTDRLVRADGVLSLCPEYMRQYLAGSFLAGAARNHDATAACRKALKLKPKHVGASTQLGDLLLTQADLLFRQAPMPTGARKTEAVAFLREVVQLGLTEPGKYLRLGELFETADMAKEAAASYREAIRLEPNTRNTPYFHNALAWCLATCRDPSVRDSAEALAAAKRAVQLSPVEHFRFALGVAEYRNRNWREVVKIFGGNAIHGPSSDKEHFFTLACQFFLAMAHWQLGETEKAHSVYQRAASHRHMRDFPDLNRFRAEAAELLGLIAPPPRRKPPP